MRSLSDSEELEFFSQRMHKSVLLEESIQHLDLAPRDIVIDGTFGGGGHSTAMLRTQPTISLVCVDLDEEAYGRFGKLFANQPQAVFVHSNFKDASVILAQAGKTYANKVLLDLGTSTYQLLADTRG